MSEGDLDTSAFYIVGSGSLQISSSRPIDLICATTEGRNLSYVTQCLANQSQALENPQKQCRSKVDYGLESGTCIGEWSMLCNTPSWGTVTAVESSVVWVVSEATFKEMVLQAAADLPKDKSPKDKALILEALCSNGNLEQMVQLRARHYKRLVECASCQSVKKGDVLMREGDLNADSFFIVRSGTLELSTKHTNFEVVHRGEVSYVTSLYDGSCKASATVNVNDARNGQPCMNVLGRGLCFGEVSMLHCTPRFFTARAAESAELWVVDRASFHMIQLQAAEEATSHRVEYLRDLGCMNSFDPEVVPKFAGVMQVLRHTGGTDLLDLEDNQVGLHILYEGSVRVMRSDGDETVLVADQNAGVVHYVGEETLMGCDLDIDSAVVTSDIALTLFLDGIDYEQVCDRLEGSSANPGQCQSIGKIGKVGLLGVSSLGPVNLCRDEESRTMYAIKSLSKGLIERKGLQESVTRERSLWGDLVSPFIVRFVTCVDEPQSLSFVLEAALGGELGVTYRTQGFFGSAVHAKYYTAAVVLALEHMHKRRFVYRNVKLSNVLLSEFGHPKLIDMSLAKFLLCSRTFTTCGAPAYMAPELIAGSGHARGVDWWAVGVLLFELLSGSSPFASEHPMDVYHNVLRGAGHVHFPETCRGSAGDLVIQLLQPRPEDRLAMRAKLRPGGMIADRTSKRVMTHNSVKAELTGVKRLKSFDVVRLPTKNAPHVFQGGFENVMEHDWFEDFNWTAMRAFSMDPPYLPTWQAPPGNWKDLSVKDCGLCLAHFSPKPQDLPQPVEYNDDGFQWDASRPS